jgi:hypothetical protein
MLAAIRRASGISPQAMLLPRAYFVQQKVFQHVNSLAVGERRTAEATGYLALNGLLPSRNLDDVVKRLALRTVEERPIVHSHTLFSHGGEKRRLSVIGRYVWRPNSLVPGALLAPRSTP